jgi:hypothetical protein
MFGLQRRKKKQIASKHFKAIQSLVWRRDDEVKLLEYGSFFFLLIQNDKPLDCAELNNYMTYMVPDYEDDCEVSLIHGKIALRLPNYA